MKRSYTVPCSVNFRDSVNTLASARGVNAADLARSILLALPRTVIDAADDPGAPGPEDREIVILKSGPAAGRPWQRKPRLQVRMAEGTNPEQIRRALGLVLELARGRLVLDLNDPEKLPPPPPPPLPIVDPRAAEAKALIERQTDEIERLRAVVSVLSFTPLVNGVQTREDALHILGFPPGVKPSPSTVRGRFRTLATIHHPDSPYGSHERMSQLNAAVTVLRVAGDTART